MMDHKYGRSKYMAAALLAGFMQGLESKPAEPVSEPKATRPGHIPPLVWDYFEHSVAPVEFKFLPFSEFERNERLFETVDDLGKYLIGNFHDDKDGLIIFTKVPRLLRGKIDVARVSCYKCEKNFFPMIDAINEWGNSGREFEPTDWECRSCKRQEHEHG